MSARTFAGMYFSWSGFMFSFSVTPSADSLMSPTRPTTTPRSRTLASGFITRPARSAVNVTGTVEEKLPRNCRPASAQTAINATTMQVAASFLAHWGRSILCDMATPKG